MKHPSIWLALCTLTAFSATVLAETTKRPNIVLLISDDDDYEHFGFMGSKIAQTPTLDKLVANGTLFTTAHCPAPLCRPSLASMLSGRMPHQHGIYGNYLEKGGIGNDRTKLAPAGSLANRLKDAGYATYATGKYWEGDPRAMGFTHGTVDVTITGFKKFVRENQDELFQFIDDQHKKKPMFIWWAPLLPHGPYNPPPKYFDRFADMKIPIPSFYKGDREEYVATMRKFYAMGTWFDDGVAQLIEKLKAAGEYENTLFLFYVDNGVTFGMPGKNSPTEKGLRAPVFVTWPGTVPAGKRIDSLTYALDLHATALDYAGIKVPSDIASKSLRPQIEGKTKGTHEALFGAVYAHQPHKYSGDPSIKRSPERDVYALYTRTKRWKYVLYTQDLNQNNARYIAMGLSLTGPFIRDQGQHELFDLDADPYEQKDLSSKVVHRDRVATFRKQALDWWTRGGGGPLEVAAHNRVKQPVTVSKTDPRAEKGFFNGKNLTGWAIENDMGVWSVKGGAIVASSGDDDMPNYQFLWSKSTVKNFHLSLMVKQTPYEANGGIQFRSARLEKGLAHGYQADVGKDWWGTLYHEHGRRVLGRRADVEGNNIKREDWNHYEILAVGQRVWLAVNGKITVALRDKFGELEGQIALQAHSGIPQTVAYKELKLIHDPKVELVGMNEAALNALLVDAPKMGISPREYLNPGSAPADDGKKAPRKGRAVGINALIKQLDLNADQKKKLAEFNQANHENLATALKLKGDEKTAAMRKINQARNAKLKEILTEEQATKLKNLQAKDRANNKIK